MELMHSDIFTHIDSSPPPLTAPGPLAGKSVAIQPNMSVRGWPTEAGSVALERFIALEDATVVKRLRAAGAKTMGSTHMSELGFGLAGDTAAQVLAEGHVDIALITDTMGEARVAASTIGVFGFKPSYGIVSPLRADRACSFDGVLRHHGQYARRCCHGNGDDSRQ